MTLPLQIGRYALYAEIAAGGMASVHFARLLGHGGFSRMVAAKRVLPHMVQDQAFTAMLMDEARLAARIRHPNVVSTLDVVSTEGELVVVMEYVHGESLSRLAELASSRGETIPFALVSSILIDALHGLHAAHEATDETGQRLGVVHRDVSPQNVLVGVDGVARIADFGIAKAAGRSHVTRDGTIKGKLSYMAPEQILRGELSPATDVFAISIVFWELLTNRPLFDGESEAEIMQNVLSLEVPRLQSIVPNVPVEYQRIVEKGLSRDPLLRYRSAREMALDLEATSTPMRASDIGNWVARLAAESLDARAKLIARIERASSEENVAFAPTKSVTPLPISTPETPNTAANVAWTGAAPRKSSQWTPLIVAVCLVLGGASALLWKSKARPPAPAPTSAASAAPLAAPPTPSASAAASRTPSAAASVPTAAPAPPRVTGTPQRAVKPKASVDCRTPYVVDSAGRRIFKLECM